MTKGIKKKGRATKIDEHVGTRVKDRRNILGMSQEGLAEKLGLTFQQVQKYENGANRIGASRLYSLSKILDVPVGFFFEGLENAQQNQYGFAENPQEGFSSEKIQSKETASLIRAYYSIPDPNVRKKVLDLAKSLSQAFESEE